MNQQSGFRPHGGRKLGEVLGSDMIGMVVQYTAKIVNAGTFHRLWVRHVMIHDLDVGE
jgi:hypothetical protein